MSTTSFSALLKRYRQAVGLSQEALASRAGLSARAISNLERGINRMPRYDTLEYLSSALALSPQQRDLLLASARPETSSSEDTLSEDAPLASIAVGAPLPPNRLIGRKEETSEALALARRGESRLLTVTGPSGVGKTRFALQLIRDLAQDFTDGEVFVSLAPIHDATLVPGVIARILGIHEQAHTTLAAQVSAYLRHKRLLLALDNFEHVMDCAPFVADLLERCPHLLVLVTSRIPLRIRAERELLLAPLPLDDAVTLFRERAQAVQSGRAYSASEIAAVCEQIDCLPLAIELAAMHVKVFSLPELRERLAHRLTLLRGGARDLPGRQQTMEDAIAWSYELLTERQQRCFRALGVFVGGWTLQGAEAMCGAGETTTPAEVALILAALVDASLIQTEVVASGFVRFRMLELVRDYALQQLRAAQEEDERQRQHAMFYARLAENVYAYFGPAQGPRDVHVAETWVYESPNVRAALRWAEEKQEAELGLRLTFFVRLWHVRGQMSEAAYWYTRMVALDRQAREQGKRVAPLTMRIQILYGLARTLVRHGKAGSTAETAAREALRLAQEIGDQSSVSSAFATLGMIAQATGKLDEAGAAYEACYRHASLTGEGGLTSRALFHLADCAALRGETTRATTLAEESLSLSRAIGMTWDIPIAMALLGRLALRQRNYVQAKMRYREALALYRAFDSPTYMASCLEGYATARCAEGGYQQAARLCATAAALREQTQTALSPTDRDAFEHVVAAARAALDTDTFAAEWAFGTAYTYDEAIDDALSDADIQAPSITL